MSNIDDCLESPEVWVYVEIVCRHCKNGSVPGGQREYGELVSCVYCNGTGRDRRRITIVELIQLFAHPTLKPEPILDPEPRKRQAREAYVSVDGSLLSAGQACAVRVAVTSFREELRDPRIRRGLGPIAEGYDARLAEVEQLLCQAEATMRPGAKRAAVQEIRDSAKRLAELAEQIEKAPPESLGSVGTSWWVDQRVTVDVGDTYHLSVLEARELVAKLVNAIYTAERGGNTADAACEARERVFLDALKRGLFFSLKAEEITEALRPTR